MPEGGTETVLVVEDNDLLRDQVTAQMKSLGYRVVSTQDAPEALTALKADQDIALLFTDVVMPGGMSGRQLADRGREIRPDLPILFTSGYPVNAITHDGRLDRDVRLLSKPYRRQDLAARIRSILVERGAQTDV